MFYLYSFLTTSFISIFVTKLYLLLTDNNKYVKSKFFLSILLYGVLLYSFLLVFQGFDTFCIIIFFCMSLQADFIFSIKTYNSSKMVIMINFCVISAVNSMMLTLGR